MVVVSESKRKELLELCDELGVSKVKERLTPTPGFTRDSAFDAIAGEWVRLKEEACALASSAKRDAREERTLAIAEEALAVAEEANRIASEDLEIARQSAKSADLAAISAREQARWAKWAAIIATVAAITANKELIIGLIL